MTPYEQGFMDKCAELGVDPTALVKQAGLRGYLSALVVPKAARFWELLRGSPAAMARHAAVRSALRNAQDAVRQISTLAPVDSYASHRNVRNIVNTALGRIKAVDPRQARGMGGMDSDAGHVLEDLAFYARRNRSASRKEMLKVVGARLGLAGGVGATGYGTYKAVSGGKEGK